MDTAIGIILVLGGLGMSLCGVFYVTHSRKSLGWPKADGIVLSSKVVHTVSGTTNHYTPTVEYGYDAENGEYTGTTIGIGPTGTLPWLAKGKVNKYREGSKVYVYYNPENSPAPFSLG